MKQRVNLTIDPNVFKSAQRAAKQRNTSVSDIVESYLRIYSANQAGVLKSARDWLDSWSKTHLQKGFAEPSDKELDLARTDVLKKKYGQPK